MCPRQSWSPNTPNRVTAEIKAAFQKHGDELVEALLALTRSDDERVRLGAIQACFDRGWGKAVQAVDLDLGVTITAIKRVIVDPVEVIDVEIEAPEPEMPEPVLVSEADGTK